MSNGQAMSAVLHKTLDEMTSWDDRLHALEVIGIADEAPDVKTFTFRSEPASWFRYKPGQFVTLELPTADGPLLRTYTLSSSPSRPLSVAVTVKAQATSIGTRWMFDNLRPGSRIRAHGPTGRFTHFGHPASHYLFLSAGSGITPVMSMLRWFADCSPDADIAFVTCVRRPEDIIFREELELLGRQMPGLTLRIVVRQSSAHERWSGQTGRVDRHSLPLLVPDLLDREVFCCGPDGFMREMSDLLRDGGFDMAHYHQESFGEAAAPTAPAEAAALTSAVVPEDMLTVGFTLSGTQGSCVPGQTILQAARAAGVRIPAACESGICGTCKTRKLSGEVSMVHDGGIMDEEVQEGYILPCCSVPLSHVEVEA